ncbi:MAG: hypothetical protein KDN20_11320 [Verrucomicrobiae bacterium]|nr:hypothetical protein [Verrucomicrobiae bacterium]
MSKFLKWIPVGFAALTAILLLGSYAYFRVAHISPMRGFDFGTTSAEVYIEIPAELEPLSHAYNAIGTMEGTATGRRVAVRTRIFTREFL